MEYVKICLEDMMTPKPTEVVYIHECQVSANYQGEIKIETHLKTFNDSHDTTKFILNKTFKDKTDLNDQTQFKFQVVQLGVEKPFLCEVLIFLMNLGMEVTDILCRTYLTTEIPDTIKPGDDGLSDFLNEIFCLKQHNLCHPNAIPFDLFDKAIHYHTLFKQIGFAIKTFKAVVFNGSGRFQYLQLEEPNARYVHNFKATFFSEDYIVADHYVESHRIEPERFEIERQRHRQATLNLLEEIEGTESFDYLLPF